VFAFRETRGSVEVAFTDRHGGVSQGPYASLDLGERRGQPPSASRDVRRNLELVVSRFTSPVRRPRLVRMNQVHGGHVHVVRPADLAAAEEPRPVTDALVTALPGTALMVRAADCVPVLLADVEAGVVGAAHAGRKGLVAGIVPNTVHAMRELGAEQLVAWIGPHVCGACYEVPEAMRDEVSGVIPQAHSSTSWGTASLDLGAGVRAQLLAEGASVVNAARCTVEEEDLYSYRRQGKESGRLAGLVWLRP
jgi:polyphenol oxidase